MKRKILLLTAFLLLIALPVSAALYNLSPTPYPVLVNGSRLNSDLPILTYKANGGDNTYVPLRAVLDMMGAKTEWDGKKVNIDTNKWTVERLNEYFNTQYSVVIVKADAPNNYTALGSGFAVLDGSYIVTNAHVLHDDKTIQVKNFLEASFYDYNVVLKDATKDIAILKSKTRPYNYTPLKLGDSDKLQIGDGVVAFGYPMGSNKQCVTSTGKVLGKIWYSGTNCIEDTVFTYPGSSGGALLNDDGEVIGVTSAQITDIYSNIAIPINEVKKKLEELN